MTNNRSYLGDYVINAIWVAFAVLFVLGAASIPHTLLGLVQ